MLRPDGSVVLVDFGVARPVGDVMHAGTRGFVAPEIGAGGAISPAADVYSLAAPRSPSSPAARPIRVGRCSRALMPVRWVRLLVRYDERCPATLRIGRRLWGDSHMNSNPEAEHRGRAFSASWSR
jgi:serine/threonine protein kinase